MVVEQKVQPAQYAAAVSKPSIQDAKTADSQWRFWGSKMVEEAISSGIILPGHWRQNLREPGNTEGVRGCAQYLKGEGMEIGRPGGALTQLASMLEETWVAWANETDVEKRERLKENVEFLFQGLDGSMASLKKEWRSAFPAPPAEVKYFVNP